MPHVVTLHVLITIEKRELQPLAVPAQLTEVAPNHNLDLATTHAGSQLWEQQSYLKCHLALEWLAAEHWLLLCPGTHAPSPLHQRLPWPAAAVPVGMAEAD